jgi:hypothetical protein
MKKNVIEQKEGKWERERKGEDVNKEKKKADEGGR